MIVSLWHPELTPATNRMAASEIILNGVEVRRMNLNRLTKSSRVGQDNVINSDRTPARNIHSLINAIILIDPLFVVGAENEFE